MVRCLAVALGIAMLGCPKPTTGPGGVGTDTATPGRSLAADVAQLTLPPGDDTASALARLDERASAGHLGAAWARLHYLLDAFDDTRFRADPASRALIRVAMGRAESDPLSGPSATDAAIDFLIVEADRLLALRRLDDNANAARALLELDAKPPTRRQDVFQRMVELKTVARSDGPLADNARLRLFGFCRSAFVDATRLPRRQRMHAIAFCLYPLYDADPSPYFATDLTARAPAPKWQHLADDMTALAGHIAESSGRLAVTGATVQAAWAKLIERHQADFPPQHSPAKLGVPSTTYARPYEWTPLLPIGDAQGLASPAALAERVTAAVAWDARAAVAVSLYGKARASAIVTVANIAAKAGGRRVELAVGYDQRLNAPQGDYWHGRLANGSVKRLGVLPLSLASFAGAGAAGTADAARATGWDPRRAALELHLVVEPTTWRLVGARGALAEIDATADPAGALRRQLAQIRAAYPDEDGLFVVIGTTTTYAQLVQALAAAQRDASGTPLFARFALAEVAPAVQRNDLARSVERRWRATVAIEPASIAPRAAVVRRCYMDLLERNPRLGGEIRIELRGDAAKVTSGPRDRKLRACVLDAVGAAIASRKVASATVALASR